MRKNYVIIRNSNKVVYNEKFTVGEQDNIIENDKKTHCSQRFFL